MEVIMLTFGVFMFPISEHSFILKAAKRLFLARTSDHEMFIYKSGDKELMKYDDINNP